MNIRRRKDPGNREVGMPSKNAATKRVDGETQVKPIKNALPCGGSTAVAGIRNAVNAPKP